MSLDRNYIQQLLAVLAASRKDPIAKPKDSCGRYSPMDYQTYVDGLMPAPEEVSFEQHCVECLSCLENIYMYHQDKNLRQESTENEQLLARTRNLLDDHEQSPTQNIFTLVVDVSKKALNLISTTGTLLAFPEPVQVRGESTDQALQPKLRVVQEFSNPALSVQVALISSDDLNVTVLMSVFDQDSDCFFAGNKVVISGSHTFSEKTTDENGECRISINGKGSYRASLYDNNNLLGQIILTMT